MKKDMRIPTALLRWGMLFDDPLDSEKGLSLEEGISRIAGELEAGLPQGRRIAAVNLESPSAYFSYYVLEELQGRLVKGKGLQVIDRSNLDRLPEEFDYPVSGAVRDEQVAGIGRRSLGADRRFHAGHKEAKRGGAAALTLTGEGRAKPREKQERPGPMVKGRGLLLRAGPPEPRPGFREIKQWVRLRSPYDP
ncbi:MAG: hypothetical protein LBU25_05610 [Treponema sp.]|jgi:hypothetical protein|nr:hypothetical protein [Treponema sp.]